MTSSSAARIMGEASLQGHFQLRVDTYFAQHPDPQTSDLSIAFALIGLDLALERGASGVDVRALHQRLGDAKIAWPHLEPPVDRGSLTVFDVALASSSHGCAGQLCRWAGSVWRPWLPHRATVEGWIEAIRPLSAPGPRGPASWDLLPLACRSPLDKLDPRTTGDWAVDPSRSWR
jgi:Family of unknown function (DUF5946)